MKLLKRILLINWHYIVHQTITIEPVTFLTGKNAAGKSTIVDALQMVMLGDTSGHFFNKAANENSRRTLKGYLFGEISEREETGIVYLRSGAFSSYVVAEFVDTVKKRSFCLGLAFDCQTDGSHERSFFLLRDELPTFHFIRDDMPLDRTALRVWGHQQKKNGFEMIDTNKRYQAVLRSEMGNLGEKFFTLFRKAVPFSPIMDVAGFISEFVCDVRHELDIENMRDNIRHYRRLEEEMRYTERKIGALHSIVDHEAGLRAQEQRVLLYDYLLDRARGASAQERIADVRRQIGEAAEKLHATEQRRAAQNAELDRLRAERDRLIEMRAASDVQQTKERLDQELRLIDAEYAAIRKDGERQNRILAEGVRWSAAQKSMEEGLLWFAHRSQGGSRQAPFADTLQAGEWLAQAYDALTPALRQWPAPYDWRGRRLEQVDAKIVAIDPDRFGDVSGRLAEAAEHLREGHSLLQRFLATLRQEKERLTAMIADLERGVKPYDARVLRLRALIADGLRAETGQDVPVTIFAEAIELPDETWQKAIEGYLHTQRFYLLVPPEHFAEALRIYDRNKKQADLYDVGLVDIGRILEQNPKRMAGSLAQEIETRDPYARAYADYLLGRIVKCDSVDELRRHGSAITVDGMLYQNFVARQLNPKRWETLYIGRRALEQQLAQAREKLLETEEATVTWAPRAQMWSHWVRLETVSASVVEEMRVIQSELVKLPALQERFLQTLNELQNLDLTALMVIEEQLGRVEAEITAGDGKKEDISRQMGALATEKKRLESSDLPAALGEAREAEEVVANRYDKEFVETIAEPRFVQEMNRLGHSEALRVNFGRQRQTDSNRRDQVRDELVRMRSEYNKNFQAGFDIQKFDSVAYEEELRRLTDTQLADYGEKIRQAKERAQIQFQEDFVSKLRSNIETVERQIADLNLALRGVRFGHDQYSFRVSPDRQYERFYKMITDDMLLEGHSLFSQSFQDQYGDVVSELFREIIDVGDVDASGELERNLHKFTDYRTYLSFDFIVTDEEGRESRLSRVLNKKSGGETQTPFYISVLASFAQLYRVRQSGADNTLRLIVFDEAYNKMDHQRIRESIRLVRQLGLQVILSAPTEKLADIAPLVDRTLIVTRIGSETRVDAFDTNKEEVLA